MRVTALFLLLLILAPIALVEVLEEPTGMAASRDAELGAVIIAQQEATRDYITAFGENTNKQFILHKESVLKDIDSRLRRFKFTLAITVFCAFLAALEVNAMFNRRRKRKINAFTAEQAQALK